MALNYINPKNNVSGVGAVKKQGVVPKKNVVSKSKVAGKKKVNGSGGNLTTKFFVIAVLLAIILSFLVSYVVVTAMQDNTVSSTGAVYIQVTDGSQSGKMVIEVINNEKEVS